MHPGIPMADDGFQGFPLTARAEPLVVREIRALLPRSAAPTTSWLDVVENDS